MLHLRWKLIKILSRMEKYGVLFWQNIQMTYARVMTLVDGGPIGMSTKYVTKQDS